MPAANLALRSIALCSTDSRDGTWAFVSQLYLHEHPNISEEGVAWLSSRVTLHKVSCIKAEVKGSGSSEVSFQAQVRSLLMRCGKALEHLHLYAVLSHLVRAAVTDKSLRDIVVLVEIWTIG